MRASVAQRGIAGSTFDHVVRSLEEILGEGTSAMVTFYELLMLGQRNEEIALELAELARSLRASLAQALRAGSEGGAFELRADPSDVASFLFALADGVTIRRLSDPKLDVRPLIDQAVDAACALLA